MSTKAQRIVEACEEIVKRCQLVALAPDRSVQLAQASAAEEAANRVRAEFPAVEKRIDPGRARRAEQVDAARQRIEEMERRAWYKELLAQETARREDTRLVRVRPAMVKASGDIDPGVVRVAKRKAPKPAKAVKYWTPFGEDA